MKRRILVPVDFSEGTKHAAEMAADLCDFIGGELVLIHAFNHYTEAWLKAEQLDEQWIGEQLQQLGDQITLVRELLIEQVVMKGTLYETLPEVCMKYNIDMVAFSHYGKSGLQRFTPSKIARLIAACPVPVIVFSKKSPRKLSPGIIPLNLFRKWENKLKMLAQLSSLLGNNFIIAENYVPDMLTSDLERQRARIKTYAEDLGLHLTFVAIRGANSFINEFNGLIKSNKAQLIVLIADEEEKSKTFKPGINDQKLIFNKLQVPVLCLSPGMEIR